MKVSYAILCYNEYEEMKRLLNFLGDNKRNEDEIVVVADTTATDEILELLKEMQSLYEIKWSQHALNNDYAQQKNYMNSQCTGDFIVNLDADEMIGNDFMELIPQMLDGNTGVDFYWVARINTVDGLTEEHIKKWGWKVNENGWVNFPDHQGRIYMNAEHIQWRGRVHERLFGFETFAVLPPTEEYSIRHHKAIEKQEAQNKYYATLS